ncbi:LacI family transcriptional regulator [Bradyrhizobium sp. AZCC 2262]|uniref:LacI family DNA-binding transcriptional regulator n=1 Tax=Bradyrhizobium sp. AZCC 2262 TaxID=3117022 RepID=UPI002FEF6085
MAGPSKGKRPTLKDVAAHVGVHYSTVSRALDPTTAHRITDEVRSRILAAVAELNYRHNVAAATLRTHSSKTIGIIVPDITNSLFGPIIKGIDSISTQHGYVALIGDTDNSPEKEGKLISTFLSRGIEGLIVASALREDEVVSAVAHDGTPIVTVNSHVDDDTVSSVSYNVRPSIGALVKHLTELGHKRIAFISGPSSWSTAEERLAAYRYWIDRVKAVSADDLIVYSKEYREEEGARCAEELLRSGVPFTALMAANDLLAFGALKTLQRHGLQCPNDISVTGFNDIPMAERWSPPLTTVRVDPFQAGKAAAEILFADMKVSPEERLPKHVLLPASMVVRGSTAKVPSSQKLKTARSDERM